MKKYRNVFFYILIIGGFSLLMYWIVQQGEQLIPTNNLPSHDNSFNTVWKTFTETFNINITHPLAILLLQIVTIMMVAKLFGFICRKIGQPSVVGEIFAGILLGPSFLGMYYPEFSTFLFPKESLGNLNFLSQIGLILFMFIVGMELDLKVLKNKAHDAVVISHASIIIPFALGMGLAYFIFMNFAPKGVNFISFGLFMGIAMSITAFPVLARIVQEKGLTKTRLGAIAITCAAADDITAWCLLAAVIAVVKAGSFTSSIFIIIMAVGYVFIMLNIVRPFLKKIGEKYSNKEGLSKPIVAIFFITLLLSSYATESIGIHALFGAFMAGVIMPSNVNFRNVFIEKVEDVSVVLLLPLFFVFTGLRTQIGLLNDPYLWKICGVIILIAVTGKFLGSSLTARFVGQNWRDSLMIGALMNTRGLMELVVLNIGYDLGVLKPEIFAMMVIMALVTTFMTGPAIFIIGKIFPKEKEENIPVDIDNERKYKILIPLGNPENGKSMITLARSFVEKSLTNSNITAIHLTPSTEINHYNAEEFERESFRQFKKEAKKHNIPVNTIFKPALDIERELIDTANQGDYDLMIVGSGKSIYQGTLLGKILGITTKFINPERLFDTLTGAEKLFENTIFDERARQIIKQSKVPLGIFVNKNFQKAEFVFIPFLKEDDVFLLTYAQKLIQNNDSRIIIYDVAGVIKRSINIKETIRIIEQTAPKNIALFSEHNFDSQLLKKQDLVLISLASWNLVVESQSKWLSEAPSILVIKPQN
jgi:Kef-type K+ transport system membrane component KefB